jgi:hypothetical protein
MIRLMNSLIGRAIAISAITIIIFSVAAVSINPYTQLSADGFSSVTPQTSSQNTPTADNKTIQTNLNTPVEINLTAKPPPTVNEIPMTVNGSSDYSNNLVDPFGIREIYPTASGGEQWFMNMSDITQDPRASFTASNPDLTRNPDGSWKVSSTEVRFNVYPSSGYHHELINTLEQQQLAAKGYMQSPNDWKNVEITGYLKLNRQGGDVRGNSGALVGGHFTLYARGGKHTGFGASQGGCEGTSYHADWAYDGTTRFAKEQWHVSYVFTPYKSATDSIIGKWVGFKMIIYNIQQNGTTAVKMEIWVDPNDDGNWVNVNNFADSGGWGKDGGECGGAPDQIISWGGPIVTYRWDNSPDVDIKDFSVREIHAPQ